MPESAHEQRMSVDEYLEFEEQSELRHEYVRGHIFAMSGATRAHNVICGHLSGKLYAHLDGSGCQVYSHAMKLRIESADAFYYPDILVTCEQMDGKSNRLLAPTLVMEVLSPSSAAIDRREKLIAYKNIASVKEYAIVHQNRKLIEFHQKQPNDSWLITLLRQDDELLLESIPGKPFKTRVNDLYDGLDMPSQVEESAEDYVLS